MNSQQIAAAKGRFERGSWRWLWLLAWLALIGCLAGPSAAQVRDRYGADDVFGDDRRDPPPRIHSQDGNERYRDEDAYPDERARPQERRDDGSFSSDQPRGEYSTGGADSAYSARNPYCRELEKQLASDYWRGQTSGDNVPDLNQKIRQQEDVLNKLQNDADRMDCYENMFIFGRELRRTKKCLDVDGKIRAAKRELSQLREQRAAIRDSRNEGNNRNRLIQELSRNNCGEQYRYEAQRNNSSNDWFSNSGFGSFLGVPASRPKPRAADVQSEQIQPYATYRTMCVRLCDGFYYPVSFSTLPSKFPQDADACRTGCAAPAELYVYRNPGGEPEQMIAPDGRRYDQLQNAWRFRKEFIQGCSCKQAEYSEADIAAYESKASGKGAGADTNGAATPAGDGASPAAPERQGASEPAKPEPAAAHVTPDKAKSIEELIR